MTTFSDFTARLNAAASIKEGYSKDLLAIADAFTREVERSWQSGGKVQFGTYSGNVFMPGTIGELDNGQATEFLLAVQFEVALIPRLKPFPVWVQKTKQGVRMVIGSNPASEVDANQPSSFIAPIAQLNQIVSTWIAEETAKTHLR